MKCLVVGAGAAGNIHVSCLTQLGHQVAVYDLVPERAFKLASEYGAAVVESPEQGSYDLAVVATTPPAHYEQVRKQAQLGRMVVCEKPLCLDADDAFHLADEARHKGWKVFVAESQAYSGDDGLGVLRMRDRIMNGDLGHDVAWWVRGTTRYRPQEWMRTLHLGGGAFIEGGIHLLAVARVLFGESSAWLGDFQCLQGGTGPDTGSMIVNYGEHFRLCLQMAWGTEGCFTGACQPPLGGATLIGSKLTEEWWPPDNHEAMWHCLIECLEGRAEPVASLEQAAGAVADAWRCYAAGGIFLHKE